MILAGECPDGTEYQLEERPDDDVDNYSLRIGPTYIEFSSVQWADHVLLLLSADGGGYVSVSHDVPGRECDIDDELCNTLLELNDGETNT